MKKLKKKICVNMSITDYWRANIVIFYTNGLWKGNGLVLHWHSILLEPQYCCQLNPGSGLRFLLSQSFAFNGKKTDCKILKCAVTLFTLLAGCHWKMVHIYLPRLPVIGTITFFSFRKRVCGNFQPLSKWCVHFIKYVFQPTPTWKKGAIPRVSLKHYSPKT